MSDINGFLAPIMRGELDTAGVLADWLEEHQDARGVLLRRRWKRWRRDRGQALAAIEAREALIVKPALDALQSLRDAGFKVDGMVRVNLSRAAVDDLDQVFLSYIRDRFPESWPPLHDDA